MVKSLAPRPRIGRRYAAILGLGLTGALLALLPLKLAVAAVGGLCFTSLVLIEPAIGLYGAILSVPIQDLITLPAGLTVTQAVVALATGAWALRILAHPDRRLNLRYQWPWVLFLSWQLLAVAATPYSISLALQQWARWIAAWLAFVLTLGTITDRRRAWALVAALLIAPSLAALIGIYQFLRAIGPPSYLILGGRFARAAATFGKPNPFAGYLNMAWPLALALALYFLVRGWRAIGSGGRSRFQTWALAAVFGAGVGILVLGLFASYSRGGWIGAIICLLGVALIAGRRTAAVATVALALFFLVGLLGAFSALPPVVVDRLQAIADNVRIFDAAKVTITDENFAVVERMAHWQAAWGMWQAHPFLGIGPGNFDSAYPYFFVGRWSISQGHAHNYYLHILAEAGLFGLVFYVLLIVAIFLQALRLRSLSRGTVWEALALGGCGIMLAVAGHNVFENLHVLNLGMQLSGVWGLMVVAERFTGGGTA